jgi:L-threonylcarbamoyladenylate synthase
MLTPGAARRLEECLAGGGLAVFPADTVYGLGCDPESRAAVARLYALKGRPAARPAAVMFFSLDAALEALPELGERERAAMNALLPGPVTLLLPNRLRRFPLACGPDAGTPGVPLTLGVRVPLLEGPLAALRAVRVPIMQSSANISGETDARAIADVPASLREGADLVLDGGLLPGTASTVLDLRAYEDRGEWRVVRAGPVGPEELERGLGGVGGSGYNC